jgi:hypothetical protein
MDKYNKGERTIMKPDCNKCIFMEEFISVFYSGNAQPPILKICTAEEPKNEGGCRTLYEVSEHNPELCSNFDQKWG